MAKVNPCSRGAAAAFTGRATASEDAPAFRLRLPAVSGAFLLISPAVMPCSGGSLRGAGRSSGARPPARVRFAVPRPFALAVNGSLALRPAVTPLRSFERRCSFAPRRNELTETGYTTSHRSHSMNAQNVRTAAAESTETRGKTAVMPSVMMIASPSALNG